MFGVIVIAAEEHRKARNALENESCLPGAAGLKGFWPILDKPMIAYIVKSALECGPEGVAAVLERKNEEAWRYAESLGLTPLEPEPRELRQWCARFPQVLALDCNTPFLDAETLRSFVREHEESGADCSFLGSAPCAVMFNPARHEKVWEAPDAASVSGLAGRLREAAEPRQVLPEAGVTAAVNDCEELALASSRMRGEIVLKWLKRGVRIMDPQAVWIGPDVNIEPGVSIMPGAQLWGSSFVGGGSVVGSYCVLRDAVLGRGVNLISNVIVENSELKDFSKAGPFAYIREDSVLDERSFAGKFVELKKTSVGRGSKVPHLSYMGDAILGENVNIGAGSVTCNYDGERKFPTKIGDRCFVGSDTMMVAPVTLGDDSTTGAGSTITADVPAGALAIGRARQKNIEGWALKKKQLKTQ